VEEEGLLGGKPREAHGLGEEPPQEEDEEDRGQGGPQGGGGLAAEAVDEVDAEDEDPEASEEGVEQGIPPGGDPGDDDVDQEEQAEEGPQKPPKPLAPAEPHRPQGEEKGQGGEPGHPVGLGDVGPLPLQVDHHPVPHPKPLPAHRQEGLQGPALHPHLRKARPRVQGKDPAQGVAAFLGQGGQAQKEKEQEKPHALTLQAGDENALSPGVG